MGVYVAEKEGAVNKNMCLGEGGFLEQGCGFVTRFGTDPTLGRGHAPRYAKGGQMSGC